MNPIVRLSLQVLILPVLSIWLGFSLWALLFGMTTTGSLGLILIPLLLQPWLPKKLAIRWNLLGLVIPIVMWQTGWKEYRDSRTRFSCTAHQIYHALHTDIPTWCPAKYQEAMDDWEPIALYKPSERVGIWIHHLAETVYLRSIGWTQRAIQLQKLHTAIPTLNPSGILSPKQYRGACNPQGPKSGTTVVFQSAKLSQTEGWIQWRADNSIILSELEGWEHHQAILHHKGDSRDATSALLQSPAIVSLKKSRIKNTWSITQPILHTMKPATTFTPSGVLSALDISIDDSMYCGLQMENWLYPYREEWHWTEAADN